MTNRDNNKHYMLYTIEEAISSLSEETGVELLADAFLDKAIAHFDKTYKSEKVSVWRHLGVSILIKMVFPMNHTKRIIVLDAVEKAVLVNKDSEGNMMHHTLSGIEAALKSISPECNVDIHIEIVSPEAITQYDEIDSHSVYKIDLKNAVLKIPDGIIKYKPNTLVRCGRDYIAKTLTYVTEDASDATVHILKSNLPDRHHTPDIVKVKTGELTLMEDQYLLNVIALLPDLGIDEYSQFLNFLDGEDYTDVMEDVQEIQYIKDLINYLSTWAVNMGYNTTQDVLTIFPDIGVCETYYHIVADMIRVSGMSGYRSIQHVIIQYATTTFNALKSVLKDVYHNKDTEDERKAAISIFLCLPSPVIREILVKEGLVPPLAVDGYDIRTDLRSAIWGDKYA